MEALRDFQLQRMEELSVAMDIVSQAIASRRLPDLQTVPKPVLHTAGSSLALAQLLVVLLIPQSRRLLFLVVDTVVAVVLIMVLVAAILSLPVGAVYVGARGAFLMGRSLIRTFPQVRALAALVAQQLGVQLAV